MSMFVFVNVFLRYAFNSGITWSEEMSRFLFVWMVFLGAILATKDNELLDVDVLVNKLPLRMKKIVFIISNLIILFILCTVFIGSWKLAVVNIDSYAPATGMPYAFLYGIGIILSVGMGSILVLNMYRTIIRKESKDKRSRNNTFEEESGEEII